MSNNRRRATSALAGLLIVLTAVALTGCGGPTDRPLRVRVNIRFDHLGQRNDPQPMVGVYYRWDSWPEGDSALLARQRAGTGGYSVNISRNVLHGSSYTLTVWAVREDTGEQIGYAALPVTVPWDHEPGTSSLTFDVRHPTGGDGYQAVIESIE